MSSSWINEAILFNKPLVCLLGEGEDETGGGGDDTDGLPIEKQHPMA